MEQSFVKTKIGPDEKCLYNTCLCWFWRRVKVGWAINVFSRRSLESNLKGKAHIRPKLWRVPKVLACSEKWSILAFGVRAQEFRMQHVPAMSPNRFLTRATVWKIIVCCFWLTLAKSAAWLFAHIEHCCYHWWPIFLCAETLSWFACRKNIRQWRLSCRGWWTWRLQLWEFPNLCLYRTRIGVTEGTLGRLPARDRSGKSPKKHQKSLLAGHKDQEPAPCLTLENAVLRNVLKSFVIFCKVLFRRPAEGPALFCLTRSNGPLHALRNRLTLPFSGCLICSRCLVTSVVTDFLGI